ncbi:TPA: hypothetical protein ACSYXF_14575, partial [Listeria monocytogenes]
MAVKDETVIKLHQKFHELLHPSNIGVDMMHNMGWSFVNGLAWIMDQLEGITDNVLSFFGFFKSAPVKQFIQDFKPLLVVLLAISFMYVGYLGVPSANGEFVSIRRFPLISPVILYNKECFQ